MPLEFSICEVKWDRYPRVAGNVHAREWLEFQATRGLAANTIEAYGRDLDSYLRFLNMRNIPFHSVIRPTIGAYVESIAVLAEPRVLKKGAEARATLANATLQQHLTVVRLFHDFLVEDRVCTRNPLRPPIGGRGLIQRHHRLPWIPSEEQWQAILQVSKQESLRNRVMLAMSYDAALRREEICSLEASDVDPAHRLLRIRLEVTKNRRERVVPYSLATSELFSQYLRFRGS
jgi:integrase/recombinase XerD